ncbi:hypothetical protein BB561_000805 [Smittium simulii]|uniref:Uncharacterized protein n=1 Tax=Smittium simulii TaxID=133385 RepID=A0A2T9YXJ5_9FUNG|nr:hypothetical protein BB561_000805 [Smittium simulii]
MIFNSLKLQLTRPRNFRITQAKFKKFELDVLKKQRFTTSAINFNLKQYDSKQKYSTHPQGSNSANKIDSTQVNDDLNTLTGRNNEINQALFLEYLESKGGIPNWTKTSEPVQSDSMKLNFSEVYEKFNSPSSNEESQKHRKDIEKYVQDEFGDLFNKIKEEPEEETSDTREDRIYFENLAKSLDELWVDHPQDSYSRVEFPKRTQENIEADKLAYQQLKSRDIQSLQLNELTELTRLTVVDYIYNLDSQTQDPQPDATETPTEKI